MVQFSMKDEYNRGVMDERQRIIAIIESIDPKHFALAGEYAGVGLIEEITSE